MTISESFSDVLARAQAGDATAFAVLYEDLRGPVLAYVRVRGCPDADDVTSEVFLDVFRGLRRFEGSEASFRAWVFTIARRRVQDAWRRLGRQPGWGPLLGDDDLRGGDVEDDMFNATAAERVAGMLAVLTTEQREVMLLRIVADLPIADVARLTGRTVNATKAIQHRATSALRRACTSRPVTADKTPTIL